MPRAPKRDQKRSRETHIYLTPGDYRDLERRAIKENRSVTSQVLYYVRRGLEVDARHTK